jgi:hypothetical protein
MTSFIPANARPSLTPFSADRAKHLFEPFYQIGPMSNAGGSTVTIAAYVTVPGRGRQDDGQQAALEKWLAVNHISRNSRTPGPV